MSEATPAPYRYRKKFDDLPQPVTMVRTPDGRDLGVNDIITGSGNFTTFLLHGSPGCRLGPVPRKLNLHLMGINLVTYDRPGYGRSDPHEGRSVADAAKDVAAIADALGIERFGVIGRSGGVAGALGCAALLGDRVINVVGLVGLAPPSDVFNRYEGMTAQNIELHRKARDNPAELQARYADLADKVAVNPASFLDDFLFEQMPQTDKDIVGSPWIRPLQLAAYHEALVTQGGIGWVHDTLATNRDWEFDLAMVRQPTLLWHGENDCFSPYANSSNLADQISAGGNQHVRAEISPSRGHFSALEVMVQALTWQRNQAAGYYDE